MQTQIGKESRKGLFTIEIIDFIYHEETEFIKKNTQPTSDIPRKLKELNRKYYVGKKEYLLEDGDIYECLVDMVIAQIYAQFNHQVNMRDGFLICEGRNNESDSGYRVI